MEITLARCDSCGQKREQFPWFGMVAALGATVALAWAFKKIQSDQSEESLTGVLDRCDKAAQALDEMAGAFRNAV